MPALSSEPAGAPALDLLLHLGRQQLRLQVVDACGQLLAQRQQAAPASLGGAWQAVNLPAHAAWLVDALASLGPLRSQLARALCVAPGAAWALVDEAGLVLPMAQPNVTDFARSSADAPIQTDPFAQTLSPKLPGSMNLATQLDWLERHQAEPCARGQWLPEAQYWAWWLSGVACSEFSALGCHTHLWLPRAGRLSLLARRRGWARRLAPLRRAWEPLAPVRPALARRLGLPTSLQVHVGAVEQQAALAAHLHAQPRLTWLRSGAWLEVLVADGLPGALADATCAADVPGLLGAVSVRGQLVPTGRWALAADLKALLGPAEGARAEDPDEALHRLCATDHNATAQALNRLLAEGWLPLPGASPGRGAFGQRRHASVLNGQGQACDPWQLAPVERAALAVLLAAHGSAWLVQQLGGLGPMVLDGPLAAHPVYSAALAALLAPSTVHCQAGQDQHDAALLGARQLLHWGQARLAPLPGQPAPTLPPATAQALRAQHTRWCAALAATC